MTMPNPRPGSPQAVRDGCTCPILDNEHGKGRWGDGETYGWFIMANCPMHGKSLRGLTDADQDTLEGG